MTNKEEKILKKVSSLKKLLVICSIITVLIMFIYHSYPMPMIKTFYYLNAISAKLEPKTILIDGYTVHYYEGNSSKEKDTLILLHGLGDDKNSFVLSAKALTDKYNIILPDLLGHGENARKNDLEYSIEAQANMLRKFVQGKNIERFHLGGNSMGGHIALSYGTRYQEGLQSLILINAPGAKVDNREVYKTYFDKTVTEEDINLIMEKIFCQIPPLPKPFKVYKMQEINDNRNFLNNIVIPQVRKSKDLDLQDKMKDIFIPTLILWGRQDGIVGYNVAEKYARNIPNATLLTMENAAHCPQLEVPQEVAAAIDNFINGLLTGKE